MPALLPAHHRLAPDRVDGGRRRVADGALAPVEPSACSPGRSSTCTTATARARPAEAEFDRVFKAHDAPTEIADVVIARRSCATAGPPRPGPRAGVPGRSCRRTRRARRKIEQGGVRLDGEVVTDPDLEVGARRRRRRRPSSGQAELGSGYAV